MDGVKSIEWKSKSAGKSSKGVVNDIEYLLRCWENFEFQGYDEITVRAIVPKKGPVKTDLKTDSNKARMSMLPEGAARLIAEVFDFGNKIKGYPLGNYRNKRPDETHEQHILRYIDAMARHLFKASEWYKFQKEHQFDEESGKLHLAHLGACVMMALDIIDQVTKEKEVSDKAK